ncbi:hypothetical protein B0T18DRAFT_396828 [Schizothecium vesticola]|uniref:Uncharacterized protein n=1 Tax=Schizothecium vesticola TaxID=314040 RepID=A0AA40F909_9PEZI|nr:hypothetical protein B0T18DRAFT_396828 [Schizothecium vesticola]
MEIQNQDSRPPSTPQDQSTVTIPLQPSLPPSPPSSDVSAPALRFPKPQGSQLLANWISTSSPDIRQPPNMSDSDNGLGDSAYEIINGAESESRYSHMSESTSSLEIPRPDEVHSLDGSEDHYDSDDDSDHSHASSIRYTAQMLGSPSTHTQTGSLELSPYPAGADVAAGSIAFQEEKSSVATGSISVKHTIRDFTENEAAAIATKLSMGAPPKRLVATVRQTMSQACLSTQEPLRILYVGHSDAKREIILKISNAIWASSKATATGGSSGQHGGGVYNIVPISSFGPSPELDLMEASQYQIKVEHCTMALGLEMESFMYSITIDKDHQKTYITSSNPDGSCSVSPHWTLPHIAIFYCADEEDDDDKQTREAAWQFMKRHAVSSIFISESETFAEGLAGDWDDYVNGDAVHVCVESRDPDLPTPLQRFPIDLATFLHIDARQMNRNLAHLAGMPQLPEKTDLSTPKSAKTILGTSVRETWALVTSPEKLWCTMERHRWLFALIVPVFLALMAPFLSAMIGWPFTSNSTPLAHTSVTDILGLASTACLARPTPLSSSTTLTSTALSTATSTATVVVNVTSTKTKTINVSQVLPTTSSLASALSFAGLLLDKPSYPPADGVKKTCSVRVLGPTEVLVVIPPNRRASFFTKEPVTVDVSRGREPVAMMTSSVDEGIVVKVPPKEAHGTLNVSVVSLRKPKINETFEVDFGKAPATDAFGAGLNKLQSFANMVYSAVDDVAFPDLAKIRSEVTAAWDQTKETGKKQIEREVEELKEGLSHLAKSAQRIRNDADLAILHAQITSKLWWLKVTGRKEELAEYKHNATVFIKARYAEMLRKQLLEKPKTSCKSGRRACSHRHADAKPDDGRISRWKELIRG